MSLGKILQQFKMIYEPNESFPFDTLQFVAPNMVGGNYSIRCLASQKPLYVKPPLCISKQGITKGKRMYIDLVFRQEDEVFIAWIERFETLCRQTIFENRNKWFDSGLELHDIENSFTPALKIYKSGKLYTVRASIPTRLGKCSLKLYNEQEEEISPETIQENTSLNTILEIQGVKCSLHSFQIDIEVKQIMVMDPDMFESCLFKKRATIEEEEVEEEKRETMAEEKRETLAEEKRETLAEEKRETLAEEKPKQQKYDMEEIDIPLEETGGTIQLKSRNDVYYEMYQVAKRKAKIARDIAVSSYLEAKQIKNTYHLEDVEDEEDDKKLEAEWQNLK